MADLDEVTLPDGTTRRLGNIEPPAGLVRAWPVFGDTPDTPLVPRSRWAELIPDGEPPAALPLLPPVHDQDGIGMCNASATCGAMEYVRARQGLGHVPLSGGDLYQRISGGVDRGSLLEDGIAAAMREGVASTRTVPYLDWRGENRGAKEERARYRVTEAFLCPTTDHIISALIAGFPVVIGIMWAGNYKPGPDGWLPRASGRAGGHALFSYRAARKGNVYGAMTQNSWSPGWGVGGRCIVPESAFAGPVGGWWAVRSVVDEGGVIPPEQPE